MRRDEEEGGPRLQRERQRAGAPEELFISL